MGRSRYKITDVTQPHFITCTVLHWIPVFTRPETVEIVLDSLRYLQRGGLNVYAYVILENHLHFIAQSNQLDKDIARFKSYTASQLLFYLKKHKVKTILDQLAFYKKTYKSDRVYQFWQEGVHPELISNVDILYQRIDYIHHNPVKRGYVDEAEHWRYSSAGVYAGLRGLLEVEVGLV
ncbi:Transposase and inactivated derivatives [hydrothermal vent metagenome]|uniref:Transposase and inactivated derivatives n=1 Tax=hydrothermal vent metagenome TaxID=652676 RepID=A0A3B0W8V7_9ZZZZ